jgi:translation initiation factor 4G
MQKEKRLAEERAKGGSEEKDRPSEALVRANEDAARREMEEHERREAEERKVKEQADRAEKERKEAEDRAALEKERKEAEERAAREEAERKEAEEHAARETREKEERENERLRLEEEARAQREALALEIAEKERAEQERLRKRQEDEEARARDEAERQRKAEEDAAEASADADVLADDAESTSLPEEGEVEDDVSQPAVAATEGLAPANKGAPVLPSPQPHVLLELPAKPLEKELLRIDTSLPSHEPQRRRPGPLNLQATINTSIAPPLPSALATARHIEDINCISYPQGIKSPRVELNVNTQKGKFRYVLVYVFVICSQCTSIVDMIAISYYSL